VVQVSQTNSSNGGESSRNRIKELIFTAAEQEIVVLREGNDSPVEPGF
jgi:hypothetical protein